MSTTTANRRAKAANQGCSSALASPPNIGGTAMKRYIFHIQGRSTHASCSRAHEPLRRLQTPIMRRLARVMGQYGMIEALLGKRPFIGMSGQRQISGLTPTRRRTSVPVHLDTTSPETVHGSPTATEPRCPVIGTSARNAADPRASVQACDLEHLSPASPIDFDLGP